MAFPLLRQVPERRDDGAAEALLAALASAAAEVGASPGARPAALREVLDAFASDLPLPPRPVALRSGSQAAALPLHLALDELRAALFAVPAREREARSLWREALGTGWAAAAIARLTGASPGTVGLAGLLHRAGEALALRAVALVEARLGTRLDAASVQAACATWEPELTATLLRHWRLAPGVGAAIQGWRRVGESATAGGEARAVYFGHAYASQLLFAEFAAPGLADELEAQLRLERRELARLRVRLAPLAAACESLLDAPAVPAARRPGSRA